VLQAIWHWPLEQLGVPLVLEQTLPQLPQLLLSIWRSTHALPHFEKPVLQVKPHVLEVQVAVPFGGAEQAFPQEPQFDTSLVVSTQFPPQLVVPVGQVTTQVPFEQTWFVPHLTPQYPQLSLSVRRLTHLPEQAV